MSTLRYRAWRFIHPDFDVTSGPPGLRISARGAIDMVDGSDSVRQAILLLLSTAPGERVMRPEYGCDLYRLVYMPNDYTTAGLAKHYVQSALERWEPRIEEPKVDAEPNAERPDVLDISLEYRVRATQRTESVRFSFNLIEGEV